MQLNTFFKNRKLFFLLITGSLFVVLFFNIQTFNFEQGVKMLFIKTLNPYLALAEMLANGVIKLLVKGVDIQNHKIFFTTYLEYFHKNKIIIENWTEYLLYLKWSAFLLLSFWGVQSPLQKKIRYTFIFILTHFFSVVSGLVILAGIGPLLVNTESLSELRPHTIGSIAMTTLLVVWVKYSISEIEQTLIKIKIKLKLPEKKINEILIVFFIYILLGNFFIPYINYYSYIDFLLRATKSIVNFIGYQAEINGPYISGPNGGTLFMAKWCLGFITMFVFSSMVYLTRKNNKVYWKYILVGLIILHILNIIRLSLLFIFVQYHNDTELIMDHHDMYNIVVYLFIFLLWIIWFEKFNKIKKKEKTN